MNMKDPLKELPGRYDAAELRTLSPGELRRWFEAAAVLPAEARVNNYEPCLFCDEGVMALYTLPRNSPLYSLMQRVACTNILCSTNRERAQRAVGRGKLLRLLILRSGGNPNI